MGRTARLVLSIRRFAFIAVAAAVVVLSLVVFALNLSTVAFAVFGRVPLDVQVAVLLRLYPFVGTAFGPWAGGLLVAVAVAFGLDAAMVTYHRTSRIDGDTPTPSGSSGPALLAFGVGCAACAATTLVGLLSLVGALRASLVLPLDGLEFTVPALVAMVLSIHWVADGLYGEPAAGRSAGPPGV